MRAGTSLGRRLAWFAVAVILGHHVGTLVGPLGVLGGETEWADWVDLLVPYAVVGTAVGALLAAGADRRAWLLAAVGGVVYTQGHGIHLAANSVGNARGDEAPVHLWDEVVGHYVWYAGLYLLMAALVLVLPALRSRTRWPLAALFGLTLATNGVEGGTPVFTLLVAAGFLAWGLRRRNDVVVCAAGVAAVLIAGWGLYHQGFPQFSELGWI